MILGSEFESTSKRPLIDVHNGKIVHIYDETKVARVVMRKSKISVGCSDITPEALKMLVKAYDARFGDPEYVMQDGKVEQVT